MLAACQTTTSATTAPTEPPDKEPVVIHQSFKVSVRVPVYVSAALTLAGCCLLTPEPVEPETVLLRDTELEVYQPIRLTLNELMSLSAESRDMILDHNDVYWCRNPAARPPGFDEITVCDTMSDEAPDQD